MSKRLSLSFYQAKRARVRASFAVLLMAALLLPSTQSSAASFSTESYTPSVLGSAKAPNEGSSSRTVNEYLRIGNYMYAVGMIDQVKDNLTGTTTTSFGNVFRFDPTNGRVDTTFHPKLLGSNNAITSGETWALEASPDGRYLYIGGEFDKVDGVNVTGIVKWDLATNSRVASFNPQLRRGTSSADVTDIKYVKGQLYVASNATSINGASGSPLMTLDPTTGARTNFLSFTFEQPIVDPAVRNIGPMKVQRIAINPANTRLVLTGNFRKINGQDRVMIALADISSQSAQLMTWYPKTIMQKSAYNYDGTTSSSNQNGLCGLFAAYCARDISWSPSGKWFVLVTTGGAHIASPQAVYPGISDSASRWDINSATENDGDAKYTWLNNTLADTFLSVDARDDYVYVGGHFKSLNDNVFLASRSGGRPDPGGIYARQDHYGFGRIAADSGAADPDFNPSNSDAITSRGFGWSAMYFDTTPGGGQGLWVGGDTNKIQGQTRQRIGYYKLPLSPPVTGPDCQLPSVSWSSSRSYANGTFCLSDYNGNMLSYQSDGNLVWQFHGQPLWSSGTYGRGASLILQDDGNIVILNSTGQPIYAASTGYNKPWATTIGQTKTLSVDYSAGAHRIVHTINQSGGASTTTALDGLYWADGRLPSGSCTTTPYFEARHIGRSFAKGGFCIGSSNGTYLIFQSDGNLVEYANGSARWHTNTPGIGNTLVFQTDGNVVIYSAAGVPVWAVSQRATGWLANNTLFGNGSIGVSIQPNNALFFTSKSGSTVRSSWQQ